MAAGCSISALLCLVVLMVQQCPVAWFEDRYLMPDAHCETESRGRAHFGRDLALVVVLKVILIAALYVFLFRPALRPAQDPAATAAAVAGALPTTADEVHR
jgi:hypothetical protein